jgi:hypothetical protein
LIDIKLTGLEGAEEGEHVRLGLPGFRLRWLDAGMGPKDLHGLALHLEICRDVSPSGGDTGMTKVVAYDCDVRTRLQKRDRTAVSQDMRRHLLARELRAILRRRRRVFTQDVSDAIARQWLTLSVGEDVLVIAGAAEASQMV